MINNTNLKNWLAITKDNKYITIDKVTDNQQDYYCPCCNEVLRGRALQSELIQPHFYHLQNDNLNSCNYETAYKRYWKENLISIGEIITLPLLKQVTCIELKNNYKVDNNLIADIYIKTDKGQEVLFLFDKVKYNFLSLNYNVFYLNFIDLEFNKSNLHKCLELLHSVDIKNLNNKLKNDLLEIKKKIDNEFKEDTNNININIKDIVNIKDSLLKCRFYKEAELIEDVLILLENRKSKFYKYKNQNIYEEEFKNLNKLIDKILHTTNLNIGLDLNILKQIDYNIYKGSKWDRFIYFDFIKPISNLLKEHIKQLESIIK